MRNAISCRFLATLGAFALLSGFGHGQGLSYVYDLKTHKASPSIVLPTGLTINRPFGFDVNLPIVASGGARQEDGSLFGGFGIVMPFRLASNLTADLGAFAKFEQSKGVGVCLPVGF